MTMTAAIYRWRGISPGGTFQSGMTDIADLAMWTAIRFDHGWHDVIVCSGDGPVPPPAIGAAGVVAAIDRHPDTGKRRWWAEDTLRAEAIISEARTRPALDGQPVSEAAADFMRNAKARNEQRSQAEKDASCRAAAERVFAFIDAANRP